MAIRNYRDLIAWQKAMALAENAYRESQPFPREEIHGLTAQLRRAAYSIPANIAEGQGRGSDKEFHHFLSIAHGSLREVETFVLLAQRLGFLTASKSEELLELSAEVGRLITGISHSIST